MPTLELLGLTPAHLTPAQRELVVAIRDNSCAWKTPRGWRPKRPGARDFQKSSGDGLVQRQLAQVLGGKGSPRLVLTSAGEEMAKLLKSQRKAA